MSTLSSFLRFCPGKHKYKYISAYHYYTSVEKLTQTTVFISLRHIYILQLFATEPNQKQPPGTMIIYSTALIIV